MKKLFALLALATSLSLAGAALAQGKPAATADKPVAKAATARSEERRVGKECRL